MAWLCSVSAKKSSPLKHNEQEFLGASNCPLFATCLLFCLCLCLCLKKAGNIKSPSRLHHVLCSFCAQKAENTQNHNKHRYGVVLVFEDPYIHLICSVQNMFILKTYATLICGLLKSEQYVYHILLFGGSFLKLSSHPHISKPSISDKHGSVWYYLKLHNTTTVD